MEPSGKWHTEHPDPSQHGQVTSNFLTRTFQCLLEAVAGRAPFCRLRYTQSKVLLVRSYPSGDACAVGPAGLGPVQPGWRENSDRSRICSWGGLRENQQKKTANWKSSLQLCCCFWQEKGWQVLSLSAQAAGQPQIHDARDPHHLPSTPSPWPWRPPTAAGRAGVPFSRWCVMAPSHVPRSGGDGWGGTGVRPPVAAQGGCQPAVLPRTIACTSPGLGRNAFQLQIPSLIR